MKNHIGETECYSYKSWKAIAKKKYPGVWFEGNKDIGQAMVGNIAVGEWDGEKGVFYLNKNPSIMQAPELPEARGATRKIKPQAPQLPKKNPVFKYFLCVQKSGGKAMTWNGERFTDNPPFKPFAKAATAKSAGKKMVRTYPILSGYKMWVSSKFHTPAPIGKKGRAMRGGTKSNPSKRSASVDAELDTAAKKLEDFTGHKVAHLESGYSRSDQKTGLIVGELDLIGYRAKRDGKTERYGHHFKKNSRPLLAVTSDGKQLHIVGGQYEFTEAGIEDR